MPHIEFSTSSPPSAVSGSDYCKYEDTPDTRVTRDSDGTPTDDSPLTTKAAKEFNELKETSSKHTKTSHPDDDPFVTPAADKELGKLSATAATFQPSPGSAVTNRLDDATPRPDAVQPMPAAVASTLSSARGISRVLTVLATQRNATVTEVNLFVEALAKHSQPIKSITGISSYNNKVYVRCTDVADAFELQRIAEGNPDIGWCLAFVPARNLPQLAPRLGLPLATEFEGQLLIRLCGSPTTSDILEHKESTILEFMKGHGNVFAFERNHEISSSPATYLVEFSDIYVAEKVLAIYGQEIHNVNGMQFIVEPVFCPARRNQTDELDSVVLNFQTLSYSGSQGAQSSPSHSIRPRYDNARNVLPSPPYVTRLFRQSSTPIHPSYQSTPFSTPTPACRSTWSPQSAGTMSRYSSNGYDGMMHPAGPPSFGNRSLGRRQNAIRVTRNPGQNMHNQNNHVDIMRIRDGNDVRTTIMLRNIPNKVDQGMLREILDKSSWGKYDFMYLRIDFANDCNVGYAFINFVDPLDIIDFVNARGNQRWNCFKSDKVAEISYATIQGKDCLVQKFRNSSVMLEADHYRPKLFFTSNGPRPDLVGQEELFPEPDNQSKMKRSCENAEHVGLFTPNAGQHFRHEQRQRRSQYDRGTRMAALEEYEYNTPSPTPMPYY